jgi:glycine cleavage system H protein
MATIRGCNLPDDLFYFLDKHVWVKPLGDGLVRVGLDTVAVKLSGGQLTAVTVKTKNLGVEVAKGKSLAIIESSKYVGPVPAPITGVLARGNDKLASSPNLVVTDPYGEGWIAEMKTDRWDTEKAGLLSGPEGLAAYKAKLEAENISCE